MKNKFLLAQTNLLLVLTMLACSPKSGMRSKDIKDGAGGTVTTLPLPELGTAQVQDDDISGFQIEKAAAEVNENTKAYIDSVKGIYVQGLQDKEMNRTFSVRIDHTDGRAVRFSGRVLDDGKQEGISVVEYLPSAPKDQEEQTKPVELNCSNTCKNLEIGLEVKKGDVVITPTIKVIFDSTEDQELLGVDVVATGIDEKLHNALKRIDRSERAVAYIVGSTKGYLTYSLKKGLGTNLLSVGVEMKGEHQTPSYIWVNTSYMDSNDDSANGYNSKKLSFQAMSLEAPSGEVQSLILKQSEDVGLKLKLGFRTPLRSKSVISFSDLMKEIQQDRPSTPEDETKAAE
ncbi:MAG: hypothetical protein AB7F59_10520 [Bdellovibrionales bacterium]